MSILGNPILILYEGPTVTCYGCNEPGHQYQDCPHRRQADSQRQGTEKQTWAKIVTKQTVQVANTEERTTEVVAVTNDEAGCTEGAVHNIQSEEDRQLSTEGVQAKVKESSMPAEENQYEENNTDREVPIEMEIETPKGRREDLGTKEPEHNWASQPQHKQDADREYDKIGKKSEKPNQTYDDKRTGKEDAEDG